MPLPLKLKSFQKLCLLFTCVEVPEKILDYDIYLQLHICLEVSDNVLLFANIVWVSPSGPYASRSETSFCFSANIVLRVFNWVSNFSMEISLPPSGAAESLVATQLGRVTFQSGVELVKYM